MDSVAFGLMIRIEFFMRIFWFGDCLLENYGEKESLSHRSQIMCVACRRG